MLDHKENAKKKVQAKIAVFLFDTVIYVYISKAKMNQRDFKNKTSKK